MPYGMVAEATECLGTVQETMFDNQDWPATPKHITELAFLADLPEHPREDVLPELERLDTRPEFLDCPAFGFYRPGFRAVDISGEELENHVPTFNPTPFTFFCPGVNPNVDDIAVLLLPGIVYLPMPRIVWFFAFLRLDFDIFRPKASLITPEVPDFFFDVGG
jgi:hypothetical protein